MKTLSIPRVLSFAVPMFVGLAGAGPADPPPALRAAGVFSDHMVLQRDRPAPVWGWAPTGSTVRVSFVDTRIETVADVAGRWRVALPAQPAGGPYELTIAGEESRVVLRDVLVGDVWLCGGQSNMEWPLSRAAHAEELVGGATNPAIRLLTIAKRVSERPQDDLAGETWRVCATNSAAAFSAVGYVFGLQVQAAAGAPVGLVSCNWGGTPAEAWTRREAMLADPSLAERVQRYDAAVSNRPTAEEAIAVTDRAPPVSRALPTPSFNQNSPSALYNGMLHPLIPYALKGVIWYQGESNAKRPRQYRSLFPTMIRNWREDWAQGDFPFLWVQLANWDTTTDGYKAYWAELREAQTMALSLPATAQAVAIDIGEPRNIHPRDKKTVGERLALAARRIAYGETNLVHSGPVYQGMAIEGSKVRLRFDHVGAGLESRGGELRWFQLAAKDRTFIAATTAIDGDTVVVWKDGVPEPVAVRYAWANNPEGCNLYNRDGLPASPFRTDDWQDGPGDRAPTR